METIVAEIITIIKGSNNPIEIERKLVIFFAQLIGQLMRVALEAIDDELQQELKAKGYRVERKDERTLQFLFGAVTFRRRRMRKAGEQGFYPLDQSCGFPKGARYSRLVQRQVAALSTKLVYRGVAQAVNLLTPFTMSHGKVKTIVDQLGEVQGEWTRKKLEEKTILLPENRKVPILLIEGDGLLVKGTQKKREEIHRVQVCEGVRRNGKRTELVNPRYFSSLVSSTEAWDQLEKYLSTTYDLRETVVLSNTDGGSGYAHANCALAIGRCQQHLHFLDRYHVHAKIKSRLHFCRILEKPLKQALWAYDWERIEVVLQTAESWAEGEQEAEQLGQIEKLRNYLQRNWPYLKRLQAYQLGEEARGIGSCESNHRIYSYRMKGNGKYWSTKGATAMVNLIQALKNETFDRALTEEVPAYSQAYPADLNRAVRSALRKAKPSASRGARAGAIPHTSTSSATGALHAAFSRA